MKRILLASVAALGLVGTASAADLAVKAPVAYVPAFTWTGCYLGANGGWIGGSEDYSYRLGGNYLNDQTPAEVAERNHSYSSDKSAGTVGGQFGCQTQFGSWVLGGEWDWNWSGLDDTNTFILPETATWQQWTVTTHKQIDWFSTARARLGLAWDRILVYATGGLAYASFDAYTQTNFALTALNPDSSGAYHENRFGWTVGGGLEWAFSNNWTAKAEFLYLDFGSFDYVAPLSALPTYNHVTSVDAKEYVARVGLNYLFHTGGAPVVARY